jgi:pimeloyl-ACP methyl ester carboxylesterase
MAPFAANCKKRLPNALKMSRGRGIFVGWSLGCAQMGSAFLQMMPGLKLRPLLYEGADVKGGSDVTSKSKSLRTKGSTTRTSKTSVSKTRTPKAKASKDNLVLVPGLLCTGALWAPQIAALSDIARCIVADHTRHRTIKGIARSILAAAPRRFALAGLSMGGYIAYEILRQAPERVERLALLDTGSRADTPERTATRRDLVANAEREGVCRAQELLMPVLIHPSRLRDTRLVDTVLQMGADTGLEAFKRQQEALIGRPDNRPLLASIRCPALVLVGREDALTPPELAREIAAGIPGAKLKIIADCGHLSTLERPEAVNRALRAWLTS